MDRIVNWPALLLLVACLFPAACSEDRLRPGDIDALPSRPADARSAYGSDPLQFGELRLPDGRGPFPVAILVHGGCWVSKFATLQNSAAVADALRAAGVATWNVEYRRLDNPGGGWPGTFDDVGDAADHLRELAQTHPLDLTRVVAVGHSAGGHLAFWLAARARIPAGSTLYRESPLPVTGAVNLGGPGDLRDFNTYAKEICRAPVIEQLMGGSPDVVPDRYAQGSPAELLPLGVRQLLIVGAEDPVMPAASREAYVNAAQTAGDRAELIVLPGASHFEVVAPTWQGWPAVRDAIIGLLVGQP